MKYTKKVMKYYETFFYEYIQSKNTFNVHPELNKVINKLSNNVNELQNLIIYGPPGIGKYSTSLQIINKYSTNELKYDKKIYINYNNKIQYCFKISDIHYEIDISLLGCNAKQLWHEIFLRIVDIISVKDRKVGIILCKNFHAIHSELLEVFYSYIQQFNHSQANIKIIFILLSEQISFLPLSIINMCQTINIKRPTKENYIKYLSTINNNKLSESKNVENFTNHIYRFTKNKQKTKQKKNKLIQDIDEKGILNIKELNSFHLIEGTEQIIPEDNFNIICDNIINEINNIKNIKFTAFRDIIYDLLTYNVDISECLYYILNYYVQNKQIDNNDLTLINNKLFEFFKYFNNNYRPIYHLESILYTIVTKIHNFNDNPTSI